MRWGTEWPKQHDLSSLRLLGSVGEPINPEAWMWYHKVIGGERCPIVDTWWQTETGAIMITPLPGRHHAQAGLGDPALPGHRRRDPDRERREGRGRRRPPRLTAPVAVDAARHLRRSRALRAASTGTSGAAASTSPATARKRDEDGYFWLMGRVDDVINVAGHRLGTMEVESALVDHPAVAEAAVVGRPHEIKGQAIAAFVTLKEGADATDGSKQLIDELKEHVVKKIGALARPDEIRFTARSAEDAIGQDHAAPAARHRRRQGARRHDDAGRSGGRRQAQGELRRGIRSVGRLGVRGRDVRFAARRGRIGVDAFDPVAPLLLRPLDARLGIRHQAFGVDDVAEGDLQVDDRGAHRDRNQAIRSVIGEPEALLDRGPHALGQGVGMLRIGAGKSTAIASSA